ncbi:MAG: phosphotransferase [Acidobacteria bacterium]|nr:phosphotransferase [Acidobacteriota bacterium]
MTHTFPHDAVPRQTSIGRQPEPPSIEAVLPAAARALGEALGRDPGDLRVVSGGRRTWSATWELAAGTDRYMLKWLPRRADRERELAQLSRRVFEGHAYIRTPRVACNPTPHTFLVEKLAGASLHSVCTAPPVFGLSAWVDSRCALLERVGTWLNRFHAAARQAQPAPLSGVKAYVLNREPALAALEKEHVDEFWRMLDSAVAAAPVRVHGDFTPHNILVDGDTVAVIDMAGINEMECESHCFDAAAMTVGLEEAWRRRGRNYLRYVPAPVHRMIGAFLGSSGIDSDDAALPVCYAVRHLTRVYNVLRTTGRRPGPRNWHVRRLRLAIERPEAIRALRSGHG